MKAIEMRNKRLQEVYRKQREAVGKKTLSDQAHSLVGETAAATQSPRCALKQEQTSGGILARSFMAWADKTSHTLLNKDHRDRNQLLKTGQSPKNRETLPSAAPLGSECWFFSPLKREDLRDCSPPALPIPPLSFSLLQKDAKLNSKDSISGLSPYRSKWDRVKAIHNLSKELAEKIEMSTKRLGATSRVKGLADQIPAETTWDLFNKSSVTEPDTSKDEQDRTMTLQMLLGDPEPAELRVSSDRAFHGLGRIGLVGTEGATDQASQNKIPTSLSGGSAGGKELPWNTHSIKPRHLSTGEDMSSTLKGFPVNKGSEVDMSLLHEKPITSPAFPSHGFLARSLQREPAAQRNHRWPETILEVQPREGIARWCPPESLRTPDSLRAQPSAAPTSVSRTRDGFKQDFASAGAGDPSCAELEEKHRSHLDSLRQTSLLLARRLKAHQLQQKQQLTVLSEKAKREVQESQRFLSDLLQDNLKLCSSSKGSYSSVPKLDHAEQTWTGSQSEGDNASGSNEEMHSLKLSELNMERDHSPVDPKIVEQRKSPGGRDSYCSTLQEGSLPAEDGELLHVHQALNLSSPLGNAPHGEPGAADGSAESSDQASLDSQWSEVGRHYGSSSTFCRFSLAMAEQCLRGEELRARHQAALLKLRRKALRAKARAELAWLGHQKRCLESLQDSKGASAVAEKQHKILTELEQQQVEIQHLQNLYRAAHQERKLLLKQQREILMMQHSTAQLQEELHNLTGKKKLTRSPATEEANKPKTRQISSSTFDSLAESTACSERPDMTGDKKSCVQLKNKESKKYDSFSTENKKTPVQHQKWAEESPSLERFLVVQGPDVSGTVTRKVCDATSQTTGLVFMIKDCKNTELNVQDHILLHLEHANSAGTDEAIATSITTDGRKCTILESVLKEKAFISNPKIEPKDNEDINPCYSKFTAKSLGMLSTLCNLCQVQSANIPQETGGDAPSLVEDQGSDSLTVEKVHGEQRSHRTPREEQDSCPFQSLQTQTQKKDPSFDTEDKERRSAVISNEATVVKAQLRKENSLQEQQRVSTDSERKAEVVHMDEKAPSEILSSEAVPVKEIEVSFPCEIHRVDDNPCLKPLNHNSHEASDEELTLKVFCKGLASAESSSKSNDFSPRCESAKSDSSLSEFQKVSAVWIDISESSTSDSELEVKNGKDTDVSIPEEFIYDNNDAFPNTSKEMPIAASIGKETLHSDKRNEHEAPKEDNSTKISSLSQNSQKCPGEASDQGCPDHLLSFLPTDKANTFKTKPLDAFQFEKTAKGMDKPNLEASESSKDAAVSSLGSDSICLFKISEQQKPTSTTSRVKKDGGINSLLMDHSRERKQLLLMDSLKHLDLATDQFSSTVSLPPEKGITGGKLVACLSSRNAAAQNNHAQLLNERLASRELDKIVSLPTSVQGISEEVHTETYSFESLQRVAPGNQNHSKTERQDPKELGKGFSSTSSKKQLFQAENCSSKGEDDTIFISDEGLPPADEDTLSEILSPVDEVLSYGSADLPSSNKKDLSFPSEDLPPPPLGVNAMKNDDSSFSMDDFPSPPEQMTVSETRQCMDEDTSLRTDALSPLLDNVGPEEFPLLSQEPTDVFSVQDVNVSEQSLVKEDKSSFAQELSEYRGGEHETPLQYLECLPVSNPTSSGQASKNPDSTLKQCETYLTLPKAEEDGDDPLSSFEIGDRVLVKQTQPGTLMFKGRTCFDCGHWAGVALDKAEGDHAGTYKGVKYFECAQHCGIFVRPNEISHLLEDNNSGPNNTGDEDSDSSYDDESFKRDCKYPEADEQGTGVTEQNTKDTKSAGGSEMPENQSRLHVALLSGKGQKFTHSDQCKCNEFLCQNNLMCLESDEEKTEVTQIKQGMLADVLLKKNKTSSRDGVNTSKNICCLLEDQKRNILADDITGELNKKLLFDTLIAFSETDQHKHKSAFEKDVMNYGKGLTEEDNLKQFLIKENPVASLSEQSAKVSDVLLCDFNMLSIHGCHTVAERIVTKFVDDAVKEYKKIKRKHGAKADKIFHSSSETSPTTLPFLIKILDAGVFGSSEDFDQPNSDEHTLERQTQKQYLYKLDRWHSAPWKKTVEVPLVVPHYSSYVKKLSASAVEELWTPENIYSNFKRISVPKHFECYDFPGNGLETESKRMYNQVIFDLTREVLCTEYQVTANPNRLPWLKENLGSRCSRSHCRRADVNEVKTFVQGEVVKIMNLEKNDLEMKRKLLNMTKYGNCEKDRVDLILIQELRREESQWTYYDDDELTVKMRMTENIFDSLILDTIRVLNKIYLRKACEVFPNSGILIPDF
nr:coiled-coil domain-containing protein 187 [Anser cygnoides]XP_047907247.1 coiled-coil domain-containing protein 187 [Anser cygnoides]